VLYLKLSVDQVVQYQSNYTCALEDDKSSDSNSGRSTYVDPLTKTKYVWDVKTNQWILEEQHTSSYADNCQYTDPKTGAKYVWDGHRQTWRNMETPNGSDSNTTASEAGEFI